MAKKPTREVEQSQAAPQAEAQDGARTAVAHRRFINDAGEQVKNPCLSTGFEYELRNGGGAARYFYRDFPEELRNALMGFGALTQAGNQINTAFPKKTGAAANATIDPVNEWFTYSIEHPGEFGPPREGGGGSRINVDRLIQAVEAVASARGASATKVVDRIRSDPEAAGFYYKNPDVKAEYARLAAGGNSDAVATEDMFD
jgi:hypothetical protein